MLTQRGRIEADIEVAVAVINGSVTGNISASERVVLDSNARVTGLIRTRALSIRLGAIFDGDCIFIDVAENFWAENGRDNRHPEMVKTPCRRRERPDCDLADTALPDYICITGLDTGSHVLL